jgi:hypothetical protein
MLRDVILLEKENDHDSSGVLSTVCGYMSDDGFTMVQRKYKKKMSPDETAGKRVRTTGNGHRTKCLSKGSERAKANEGNDQKRSQK